MEKITSLLLFLIILSGNAFNLLAEKTSSFKLPDYEKVTLKNGITLYLMEQHEVPLIYISNVFKTGSIFDGNKNGLAYLTALGLKFGTKNYTKNQIEESFDFIGASLNSSAGKEAALIEMTMAAKDLNTILDIWKEMVVDPSFDETEFKKRKTRLLMELEQDRESPNTVIRSYFNKFIYDQHVYGNPVKGTRSAISKLTVNDLIDFYQQHYVPSKMAIIITGDFKTSEMVKTVKKLFGAWKPKESDIQIVYGAEPEFTSSRILLVNKEDARQTSFYIGGLGIKRSNPDYIPIQVINTILGGRFTSWLNDELRVNAGLTYGAVSSFTTYKMTGDFTIRTFTGTATTIEAIDLALKTYSRLFQQGIDEATLESAKNYMNGQFPPRYETAGELATLLADMYIYDFDESYINQFQNTVNNMTPEQASDIIQKYFPRQHLQFTLIGKASEIRKDVEKYGLVIEKEITEDEF